MAELTEKRSLVAAGLAAIGASVCCAGPLVLLSLGISGAWISNLTALEPARPYFIGVTLIFLALAFRKLYLVPATCEPGQVCVDPKVRQNQRIIFWVITGIVATVIAFPWYAPLFY